MSIYEFRQSESERGRERGRDSTFECRTVGWDIERKLVIIILFFSLWGEGRNEYNKLEEGKNGEKEWNIYSMIVQLKIREKIEEERRKWEEKRRREEEISDWAKEKRSN